MSVYRIVDVKPGSPEWLEWRDEGIGASLAPVIMGDSPYQTPRQLAEERLGLRSKRPVNEAMRRGSAFEASVREIVNFKRPASYPYRPDVCVERVDEPFIKASLDGFCAAAYVPGCLEIKLVSDADFDEIERTRRPLKKHLAQLAQQAYVLGGTVINYAAYTVKDGAVDRLVEFNYTLEADYIAEVIANVRAFYQDLSRGYVPPPGPRDVVTIEDPDFKLLLKHYEELKRGRRALDGFIKDTEQQLWEYVGDRQAKAYGYHFQTFTRKGAVDYSKVPELRGVDLDAYRKPPTVIKQIRGIDEEEKS